MTQHLSALATANEHRLAQAELRSEVTMAGRAAALALVADFLECAREPEAGIDLDSLLRAVHRIGPRQVEQLLEAGQITSKRKVRELTPHQRVRLAGALRLQSLQVAA